MLTRPIIPCRHELKTLDEIKEAMISACSILDAFGLERGFGHISSRLPNSTNLLATPKKAAGVVKRQELITLDSDGRELKSHALPYGGINISLSIYRKRPDAGAVCFFWGGKMVEVLGVLGRSVRPIEGHFYVLGPEVRVVERKDLDAQDLRDTYGIIFRGHGAATFGTNIIDACVRAAFLEECATIQYRASLIGEPVYVPVADMDARNERYWNHPEYDVYWRAWELYKSRIEKLVTSV